MVVTAAKGGDKGRVGKMPRYVTESGYEETDDERKRVSDAGPQPHQLKLVEVATGKITDLAFDDELLREQAKIGILLGSLTAAVIGTVLLRTLGERFPLCSPARRRART